MFQYLGPEVYFFPLFFSSFFSILHFLFSFSFFFSFLFGLSLRGPFSSGAPGHCPPMPPSCYATDLRYLHAKWIRKRKLKIWKKRAKSKKKKVTTHKSSMGVINVACTQKILYLPLSLDYLYSKQQWFNHGMRSMDGETFLPGKFGHLEGNVDF